VNSALSFGLRHLGPVISQYAQACPEVTVDITLDDRRVDILEEAYDLAIRVGELEDSTMIARKFASVRRVCAASPEYLERHGTPRHPNDLADHNCLTYARGGWSEPWLVEGDDGPVLMEATGNIFSNNGDLLLASAVEGAGIISMPDFIVWDSIREGRLVRVLEEYTFREVGMYAIYPPTRHLSAKIRTFVDTLVDHFSPEPYWLIR